VESAWETLDAAERSGALFVLSMVALSSGIVNFLREVHTATHTLRIGPP